jgi:hypothetical protein
VAAGLKLAGFPPTSLSLESLRGGGGNWGQILIAEWELVVGIWLISGWRRAAAWSVAIASVAVFVVASGYSVWAGRTSCGCLGAMKADPRLMLAIDLVALLALVVVRPSGTAIWDDWKVVGPATAWLVGGAGVLSGLTLGIVILLFGSVEVGLARLRGEVVSVQLPLLDLGVLRQDEIRETSVTLMNWMDSPVLIYGATSNCDCLVTEALPVTIEPRAAGTVMVKLRAPPEPGTFFKQVTLYTDAPRARTIPARITGSVTHP